MNSNDYQSIIEVVGNPLFLLLISHHRMFFACFMVVFLQNITLDMLANKPGMLNAASQSHEIKLPTKINGFEFFCKFCADFFC